jgi:hypothetical protein
LSTLSSSEIKVPTIKGSIEAKFSLTAEGEECYEIKIPKNMNGEFGILGSIKKVYLNNQEMSSKVKTVILKEGVNLLVLKRK